MDRLDLSLSDIIQSQKEQRKKASKSIKAGGQAATKPTGLVTRRAQGRAAGRVSKRIPYARPLTGPTVKKEVALFTETYKALSAPIKEIFTASYVPKTTSIKLTAINDRVGKARGIPTEPRSMRGVPTGPAAESKPLRLFTTQTVTKGRSNAGADHTKQDFQKSQARGTGDAPDRPTHDHFRDAGRGVPSGGARRNGHDAQNRNGSTSNSFTNNNIKSNNSSNSNNNNNSNNSNGNNHSSNSNSNSNNSVRNSGSNSRSHNGNQGSRNTDLQRSNTQPTPDRSRQTLNDFASRPSNRQVGGLKVEPSSVDMTMDVDMEEDVISFKARTEATSSQNANGPVTIEIQNLHIGTTAEDVKYVCSRFGEILSCICTNGFAQVTYARKAAGQAAVENLNGKKADDDQILRVSMRSQPVMHDIMNPTTLHTPTLIAGPMKLMHQALRGTIPNANDFRDQLQAAQLILKMQQDKMAELQQAERRINNMRLRAPGAF